MSRSKTDYTANVVTCGIDLNHPTVSAQMAVPVLLDEKIEQLCCFSPFFPLKISEAHSKPQG